MASIEEERFAAVQEEIRRLLDDAERFERYGLVKQPARGRNAWDIARTEAINRATRLLALYAKRLGKLPPIPDD